MIGVIGLIGGALIQPPEDAHRESPDTRRPPVVARIRLTDSTDAERLSALGDDVWRHQMAGNAFALLRRGLPVKRLPDYTPEGARADRDFWTSISRGLTRIRDKKLDHQGRISKAILAWQARQRFEAYRHYWFTSLVTPYATPIRGVHRLFASLPVTSEADRQNFLGLLAQYPALLDVIHQKLKGQQARGIVLPKAELALVVLLWRSFVRPVGQSPFDVDSVRLATVSPDARARFTSKLAAAINDRVNPALEALIAFIEGPYYSGAPDRVGLWQYPGGKAYYHHLVRVHTTLSIEPNDVFAVGQRQIDSLSQELSKVQRLLGFAGTLAKFISSLRSDPRFFASTPEEVGRRLDRFAAEVEPKLASLFLRIPVAKYETRRLALDLEPTMTYGYYDEPRPARPTGVYFYNGSNLDQRNLANIEGLAYHELVPGHHLQIALLRENTTLPTFRQDLGFTAYGEGWGDYASMLGNDLGQYRDAYSRAGRLMMEMMLGTRLVLDVGMNYRGWSLEQAREFMRKHTLEGATQIETETLRYGADQPGQALAYRMGSLTIQSLRERTRRRLGPDFDIRRFHEAILGSGQMPLDVLAWHVGRFVEEEEQRHSPTSGQWRLPPTRP